MLAGKKLITEKEIRVLELRKKGMTQVDVALKLGISQGAVSSFEKNAMKKIEDAIEILEIDSSISKKMNKR